MAAQKLVVFDLDGTLNRTDLYSVPAHLKALEAFGVRGVTAQQIISTFGGRAQDYVKVLLGETDPATARAYLDMVAAYEAQFIREKGRAYDGVEAMLDTLRTAGYQTAVCSNSPARYIKLVLSALALDERIDFIRELIPDLTKADTLHMLLEKASPAAAVMVGDRRFDLEAARANAIPFIGCLYGYAPREVEDADETVCAPDQIVGAVARLIGFADEMR